MIPTLTTERLKLRGWREEDIEAYARFKADIDFQRYLTGEPLNRDEAWRSMAMVAGHWVLRGYGMWALGRASDGALIGLVGLHCPEGWPGPELGWALGKEYWGMGYATEAAGAAMAYAFLTQPLDKVISIIHVDNLASQAVAERLGEVRGPRHDVVHGGKTFPTEIWSIARADWTRGRL